MAKDIDDTLSKKLDQICKYTKLDNSLNQMQNINSKKDVFNDGPKLERPFVKHRKGKPTNGYNAFSKPT